MAENCRCRDIKGTKRGLVSASATCNKVAVSLTFGWIGRRAVKRGPLELEASVTCFSHSSHTLHQSRVLTTSPSRVLALGSNSSDLYLLSSLSKVCIVVTTYPHHKQNSRLPTCRTRSQLLRSNGTSRLNLRPGARVLRARWSLLPIGHSLSTSMILERTHTSRSTRAVVCSRIRQF